MPHLMFRSSSCHTLNIGKALGGVRVRFIVCRTIINNMAEKSGYTTSHDRRKTVAMAPLEDELDDDLSGVSLVTCFFCYLLFSLYMSERPSDLM